MPGMTLGPGSTTGLARLPPGSEASFLSPMPFSSALQESSGGGEREAAGLCVKRRGEDLQDPDGNPAWEGAVLAPEVAFLTYTLQEAGDSYLGRMVKVEGRR